MFGTIQSEDAVVPKTEDEFKLADELVVVGILPHGFLLTATTQTPTTCIKTDTTFSKVIRSLRNGTEITKTKAGSDMYIDVLAATL